MTRVGFSHLIRQLAAEAVALCMAPLRWVVRQVLIRWAQWRLDAALDELRSFQAQFQVGPVYLCNLMQHVNYLEYRIAQLRAEGARS